nr:MAG TPA: hypothetical protein [Caudoviricetes sp.]
MERFSLEHFLEHSLEHFRPPVYVPECGKCPPSRLSLVCSFRGEPFGAHERQRPSRLCRGALYLPCLASYLYRKRHIVAVHGAPVAYEVEPNELY